MPVMGAPWGNWTPDPATSARNPVGYFPLLRLIAKSSVFTPSINPLVMANECQDSDGCGGKGGIFWPVLVPLILMSTPSLSQAHCPLSLTVLRSKPDRLNVVR